jgi:hypothetical protein
MKYLKNYTLFQEESNPNTPEGYLKSLSQKPKLNKNKKDDSDDVDSILQNAEEQKQKIVAKKDVIEKGLLNNIRDLEPENQKDVKTQVNDYRNQVKEFDKTVTQIDSLNKTLKKSNTANRFKSNIQNARGKNNF